MSGGDTFGLKIIGISMSMNSLTAVCFKSEQYNLEYGITSFFLRKKIITILNFVSLSFGAIETFFKCQIPEI